MEETKPIKRSKELAPLSREHHDGLLFVWKIKQGLANNAPLETMCRYTRWFWDNHIKPHFKDEEKVLISYLPANHALVRQMIKEHTEIRDLILSLDQEPDTNTLKILAEFLNNHIRFEERQLFAYAEEVLTPAQLQLIYQQLDNETHCGDKISAQEWKEEFWIKANNRAIPH